MDAAVDNKQVPALMWKTEIYDLNSKQQRMVWRRITLPISRIIDNWIEMGRWWEGEGAAELMLADTASGVFLLWHEHNSRQWYAKPLR